MAFALASERISRFVASRGGVWKPAKIKLGAAEFSVGAVAIADEEMANAASRQSRSRFIAFAPVGHYKAFIGPLTREYGEK